MTSGARKGHHKVIWTDAEWRAVALALLKVRPDYIDHPHPMFDPGQLRDAMTQVLTPERYRPIPEIGGSGCSHFRPGFMKAYRFIREAMEPNGEQAAELLAPPTATEKEHRHKRVMWSDVEFLALAQYLRKRYPAASYIESSTCAGLHLSDVREAMQTLPRERHRNLHTITPLRKFFITAFKLAKAEQYRDNERAERERLAASRQVAVPAVPSAPPPAATNPYEAVFAPMLKPLIGLLATELMAQLAPQITQLVNDAIAAALPSPEETDDDQAPPDNVAQLPARGHHPAAAPPPKKVMVGVVGPLPNQRNELERAFPHLHIVTLEGGNTNEAVARLRNARRVIGMTSFMNHSMDGALAKQFSDRYMRVHGGVSSIKRQIKVWEDSGVLAA